FDVEGDARRPFVVTAGDTRVTALGTRFDVRRVGPGARVVLIEGRVAVRGGPGPDRAWSLAPGQQVVTAARRPAVAAADVPAATSWASGRLTFRETPIGQAVAEVNRYSPRRIDLQASEFAAIPVSGVFDTGDVDGFVAALTDLYPLRATRSADGTIVLSDGASK
ncbi:MAG: FecR domain-containing protein, partial [Phenylobacterium sp.]|nr:FecR domain-containing protein [Phenylobacterium sp.]